MTLKNRKKYTPEPTPSTHRNRPRVYAMNGMSRNARSIWRRCVPRSTSSVVVLPSTASVQACWPTSLTAIESLRV